MSGIGKKKKKIANLTLSGASQTRAASWYLFLVDCIRHPISQLEEQIAASSISGPVQRDFASCYVFLVSCLGRFYLRGYARTSADMMKTILYNFHPTYPIH